MNSNLAELERICLEALTLPPEERSVYLAFACKDESMRREVQSLLSSEGDARNLFPTFAPRGFEEAPEDYGTTGVYEIHEKLGEGGMGLVFRARQSVPVARDVALKIVRPGMASRELVARFLMERQALAIMDHPNIARVLDAGETSRGLPYLVMELVAGQTIAAFCREKNLGFRERIGLMIQVCQAIQHAHQKGIIHRDIKPSNVLVTVYDGEAMAKVIDFGIAKAIDSLRAEMPGETRAGVMMGTFELHEPRAGRGQCDRCRYARRHLFPGSIAVPPDLRPGADPATDAGRIDVQRDSAADPGRGSGARQPGDRKLGASRTRLDPR